MLIRTDWYHSILEYSWYKLLLGLTVYFVLIHLFFGSLYFAGLFSNVELNQDYDGVLGIEEKDHISFVFFKCFCFSVQTMTTIGYGTPLAPYSFYVHLIVVIQAYWGLVTTAITTGISIPPVLQSFIKPYRLTNGQVSL